MGPARRLNAAAGAAAPEEGAARLQSRPARLKEGISMAKCSRPVSTALNVMRPVSDMTS